MDKPRVHASAAVDERATLGAGVAVWNWVQVREGAVIGDNTSLAKGVYVDYDVRIGANAKVQNNASIYHGVTIEDGVFVGPHVCFTNDRVPRAITRDGTRKDLADWTVSHTHVKRGASIGANATILPGITIGEFALVGAGAVVTKDVADYELVLGAPARHADWVCECGRRVASRDAVPCRECRA